MHPNVTVVDHPLIQHKLTLMRQADTSIALFRQLLKEISLLLAYEVTRDLETTEVEIKTPLETMSARQLEGKKLCLVSILRAGNGLLDGMLDLVPLARVAHIGLYRDPQTLVPVEYYFTTTGSRMSAPSASSSSACWRRPRGSPPSPRPTPTCRSTPRPSIAS